MAYHIGQELEGKITGIQPYGAFVVLNDYTQGLIHISECKSGIVQDLKNELRIGKIVKVTVLDIEQYTGKISLSLRQDNMSLVKKLPKNSSIRKYFWTNNHLDYGFDTILAHRDEWVDEALKRIAK